MAKEKTSPKERMSVAKVIEVISEGKTIEGAIKNAALKAHETVRHVKHVNVENIQAMCENGEIYAYRVNAKVTFLVE